MLLTDYLFHWGHHAPDSSFIYDVAAQEDLRYGDAAAGVRGVAHQLKSIGIKSGDRVALLAENSQEWVVSYLATMALGAVIVPVNTRLQPQELDEVLDDCEPVLVIADGSQAGKLPPRWSQMAIGTGDLRYGGGPSDLPDSASPIACITYTSGSTGRPKGVMLSPQALLKASLTFGGLFQSTNNLRTAVAVPLFHNTGFIDGLSHALAVGGRADLYRRFAPDATANALLSGDYNFFIGVPTMYGRMVDGLTSSAVNRCAPWLAYGGSAMPTELARRLAVALPNARLVNVYGLSEATSITHYLPWLRGEDRWGCIGRCAPGTLDRISATGELEIDSPTRMIGYWRQPQATAEKMAGQWLRTGDLAVRAPDGLLEIVGRMDEAINRGGEKVMPYEVEGALLDHPAISEAAVVGRSDPDLGQVPVAFVTLRQGTSVQVEELLTLMAARLADYKRPAQVTILGTLPRIGSGKLDRAELRRLAAGVGS